jgi:AbiU2
VQAPLPIDDRIERAAQLVLRARIYFDVWFYFEGRDTRAGIMETMQEYSEFFRFAPHAHFVAFIVSIAALFDKRRDTITLPGLVREMGKANLLPAQTKSDVTALIAQAGPLVSKITILRHNAFAHRSATLSYDEAFKAAAVTAFQMRELTEIALKIANCLTQARGRGEHFFNELVRNDAEAMMKALSSLAASA